MRRLLVVAVAGSLTLVPSAPAGACSTSGPITIEEAARTPPSRNDTTIGLYEVRTIAWAPSIPLRGARSIHVVTRWWGVPPENLGPSMSGTFAWGMMDNCGNGAGSLGETYYHMTVDHPEVGRTRARTLSSNFIVPEYHKIQELPQVWEMGPRTLSAEHIAFLDGFFGPGQIREISALDHVVAHFVLWKDPALALLLLWAGGYLVAHRLSTGRAPKEPIGALRHLDTR